MNLDDTLQIQMIITSPPISLHLTVSLYVNSLIMRDTHQVNAR
jgi:hypothetical protein